MEIKIKGVIEKPVEQNQVAVKRPRRKRNVEELIKILDMAVKAGAKGGYVEIIEEGFYERRSLYWRLFSYVYANRLSFTVKSDAPSIFVYRK